MADVRVFTEDRRAQGFRSQEHLDAFFACRDHEQQCTDCGPGASVLTDDGWQATFAPCAEAKRLSQTAAKFSPYANSAARS